MGTHCPGKHGNAHNEVEFQSRHVTRETGAAMSCAWTAIGMNRASTVIIIGALVTTQQTKLLSENGSWIALLHKLRLSRS